MFGCDENSGQEEKCENEQMPGDFHSVSSAGDSSTAHMRCLSVEEVADGEVLAPDRPRNFYCRE
jgi:hypothetical protein